jgi:hypothetical protein
MTTVEIIQRSTPLTVAQDYVAARKRGWDDPALIKNGNGVMKNFVKSPAVKAYSHVPLGLVDMSKAEYVEIRVRRVPIRGSDAEPDEVRLNGNRGVVSNGWEHVRLTDPWQRSTRMSTAAFDRLLGGARVKASFGTVWYEMAWV